MADINILIVVDGIFTFGPQVTAPPQMGQPDQRDVNFSITQLMNIFDGSASPSIAYKKAHRQTDPSGAPFVDFNDFDFATSVDLTQFDEIWMLGHDGTNIDVEDPPPNPPVPAVDLASIGGTASRTQRRLPKGRTDGNQIRIGEKRATCRLLKS